MEHNKTLMESGNCMTVEFDKTKADTYEPAAGFYRF